MNVFKKIITYTCSISMLCLLMFIGMAISINGNMTEKASAASCLGTSGAQNVRSVQQACERCEDGRAPYGSGALWFNDGKKGKNSDVVTLTNAEASKETVKIYLWGQYYSCGSKNIGSNNTATHIWFGEVVNGVPYDEGDSNNGVNGVNFILENNASKHLYRGKVVSSYAWLENGAVIGNSTPIRINVNKFKEYARTHGTAPSKEEEAANHGGGTYIADVSVNRCSNDPYNAYMNPSPSWSSKKDACYGDISTITVIIEPDDTETKVEEAGQVRFVSQSIVHTDPQGDISNHTEESSVNGNDIVTLYLSTESDTVNVQFQHKMKYLRESRSSGGVIEPLSSLDQLENGEYIKTNFTVNRKSDERSGDPEANKEVGSGTYPQPSQRAVTKDTLNGVGFTTVNGYNSYTIKDLKPGETVKVCERIEFRNAIFPLEREEKFKHVPAYTAASVYHGQALYRRNEENDSYYGAGNAYYHYGTLPDGSWGLIQGASIGDSIFDSNGESLYEIAYVGMGEYVGQAVYIEQYVEVPKPEWGVGAIYGYTTYVPTSIHHYDYNSNRWVPGYDKDGWNAGPNGEPLYEQNYETVHDYWIYRPNPQQGEDGSYGFSAACISVTRPEDPFKPGDTDPDGEKVKGPYSGELDEGFLYAGETADMEWNVGAMGYATRRIMEARAIVYQPTVNTIPKDDISKGNLGADDMRENKLDPCAWYKGKVQDSGGRIRGEKCATVGEIIKDYGADGFYGIPFTLERIKKSADIIIPDEVGDKLCNSFGFRFQYWYGVTHENDSGAITEENWTPEDRKYWANYDAACRTIVKKPSLNVWNGSLFTNSDIATTVANRYTNPRLGDTSKNNNGSSRNIFGSWSEYLVVPYGKIKAGNIGGFASGASLGYRGFDGGNKNLLAKISPLTIANSGPSYGESGIISGSTYRARLSTYLKSLSTLSDITELYGKDINESKIIHVEGSINITDNIKLSSTERPSVYGLPQVIIFADGDINIKPNVSRIDAWLISGGTVYTCDEFVEGKAIKDQQGTEAYVKDYHNSGDTRCSQQLTINGPVIAKKLVSNRSAGSDPNNYGDASQLGDNADARALPGEVFNLGADAYLWSYAQAGRYDSSYSESYIRELPPRY